MNSKRTLAAASILFALGCGHAAAPPEEDSEGALETAPVASVVPERELRCGGLRFFLRAIGQPSIMVSEGRTGAIPPGLEAYAGPRDGVFDVTTTRRGNDVSVAFKATSASASREVLTDGEVTFPAALWNDTGRAATERGDPIVAAWFEAPIVRSNVPMRALRCEQSLVPTPQGVSGAYTIRGANAERLFDMMNVPVSGGGWRDEPRGHQRPFGSKTIATPGVFSLSCLNHPGEPDVTAGAMGSDSYIKCDVGIVPRAVARELRAGGLVTYRTEITEREKAGRLFNAFEGHPSGRGLGVTLEGLAGPRDAIAPGTRLSIECIDEGDFKTTCHIEVVTGMSSLATY